MASPITLAQLRLASHSPHATMALWPALAANLNVPLMTHVVSAYRISGEGVATRDSKPPTFTKRACLANYMGSMVRFARAHPHVDVHVIVLGDCLEPALAAWVNGALHELRGALPHARVDLRLMTLRSNSGSFKAALHAVLGALRERKLPLAATATYLPEDDYMRLPAGVEVTLEGLSLAPYATGYAHPDKTCIGQHALVEGGELCVAYSGVLSDWRTTTSTTMTFAAAAAALVEDADLFETACADPVPNDCGLWPMLASVRRRALVMAQPGVATHGELAWMGGPKGTDWAAVGALAVRAAAAVRPIPVETGGKPHDVTYECAPLAFVRQVATAPPSSSVQP